MSKSKKQEQPAKTEKAAVVETKTQSTKTTAKKTVKVNDEKPLKAVAAKKKVNKPDQAQTKLAEKTVIVKKENWFKRMANTILRWV